MPWLEADNLLEDNIDQSPDLAPTFVSLFLAEDEVERRASVVTPLRI
jgi:hypothetical protein